MAQKTTKIERFSDLSVKSKLGLPLLIMGIITGLVLVISLYLYYIFPNSATHFWLLIFGAINTLLLTFIWLIISYNIAKPLADLAEATDLIAQGELEVNLDIQSKDEIGHIANSTLTLSTSIRKAREFAKSIGEGNYEVQSLNGKLNERKDSLFVALMSMRDQLKKVAEMDNKRNWITKGMAEFTEILRSNDTDLKQLGSKIITGLARYMGASQGAIFVMEEENEEVKCLEMLACYAYEEAKFLEKKIMLADDFGEGLIGQAFLERDTIYLTDIPEEYINIASGLGESNPRSVLIVPLELNNRVEGVLELASLQKFAEHEIEFVERLSENIASAILSLKVNENTKKLLKESQELTSLLQSQEEELRQNYEELQATQEMVQNKNQLIEDQKVALEQSLREQTEKSEMLQAQEEEMRQNMEELVATQEQMMITQAELDGQLNAINNSTIVKAEYDLDGRIVSANESFCNLLSYNNKEIKGLHHSYFVQEDYVTSDEYLAFWHKLSQGISQAGDFKKISKSGEAYWVSAIYSPVYNRKGEIYKIIELGFDITEAKRLLEETQTQAQILQAQEQELRQNMEELKTTQLELNTKNQAIIELKEEEAKNAQLKAKEIESKNQLITSSIQYAQNIQRAILPLEEKIRETFQDFFVIYLPKDIVSGDFYWFSQVDNNTSFFAAVDCTGHGVPGAFMSIIGNTLLNEIVNVQQIYDTGKILEMLHEGVRTKLRQVETSNYDGMDVGICKVEYLENQKVKLTFSGAKRPLYYYAKVENKIDLMELKGDRKSIGGWQQEVHRTFEREEIILNKDDIIYLTTDGLADSPNFQRKKFGVKKFKDIIINSIHLNMRQQRKVLLGELALHQQGSEQRDDITIVGIKL